MWFMPEALPHTSSPVLEFNSLRQMLRGYCWSPLGQGRIGRLQPTADRAWIERQQQLTAEVRRFLRSGGHFDFSGLNDPGALVEKSRIEGAALETAQLRDIVQLVDRADEWRHTAQNPPSVMRAPKPGEQAWHGSPTCRSGVAEAGQNSDPWPAITELSSAIADFTEFLRFFRNKILPDGTLDDRASPELARVRRDIEKQKRLIQDSLRSYLRRLAEGGAVQEELVTIRGERFVIPVKVEQKKRVQGVIHGASSSGQTVFVEPLETIEQNNELVRLLEEEQEEIHRILLEMTRRVAEQSWAITSATDALAELELQFSKARFAEDYQCTAVTFVGDRVAQGTDRVAQGFSPANQAPNGTGALAPEVHRGTLVLHNARHPLLERTLRPKKQTVVPISVELDPDRRQLVITGPNTGGKTVSLKTIGLLALMAQSGMPVPADRAELPVFDAVLADIGDYQSIEQNLSTFSAHVTNIDFISRTATPHSLVLLDELGSATDPEEGAALAVAIAEHFRHIGCLSVVSTHHTSLKIYGANTPGVLNAAVGFDERTLQPTYDLRVGVPGASAGINIAQRLGLNPTIIASARSRLGVQAQDVGKFLDRLHGELREAESERRRLQTREQELQREKDRLAVEGLKEQRARIRELDDKLGSLMRDFEYHAREAVQAVQDRVAQQKLSKEAERRIAKLRREFREQFDQTVVAHTTGADREDQHAQPHLVQRVLEGDTVKLKSLGRTGQVKRKVADDLYEVAVGPMTMKIRQDDIAEVIAHAADNPVKAARARGVSVTLEKEDLTTPTEINVIGRTVDDATREVEKFVDRAFLAGLPKVRIVHGSGMGILRKALREYLKSHPHVASVTEPPQQEGGGGATVVELRV
jgi:DNA mismatch repair protein MutS2